MGDQKKKLTVIGASAVLLVAVVAVIAVTVNNSHHTSSNAGSSNDGGNLQTSTKAIQSLCQPTDYKEACETSLTKAAGNTTDPKELIKAAFDVAIEKVKEGFAQSEVLQAAAKDRRTKDALDVCKENLDFAIDDLKNSFDRFGPLDLSKIDDVLDDLQVWLSSALTYHETCLDGFENTPGEAADGMRRALNASAEFTNNALAIMNSISLVLKDFKLPFFSRRLLSVDEEGYPAWVSAGKRKLLAAAPSGIAPNVTVAQDGSGDYKTINEALAVIPKKKNETFVIYIKQGVYKEKVWFEKSHTHVMIIGDGPTKTKITGNLNYIDGTPTFKTATVAVMGDGFVARDIGFENSAGPEKHQAVALRVQSDMSIFYNVRVDGYQDTLYAHSKRQFYRDCTITGTVDFIFGDAESILQNCLILARRPLANQQNIVTAQGRKFRQEKSALVLHNCTISADPSLVPVQKTFKTYLGRPWKEYSRTIIMQSQIDDLVHPDGWLPWMGTFALDTCYYTEFDNRGPGSVSTERVKWKGVKSIDFSVATTFTVEQYLSGNVWLKPSGVPYIPGLLPLQEPGRIH